MFTCLSHCQRLYRSQKRYNFLREIHQNGCTKHFLNCVRSTGRKGTAHSVSEYPESMRPWHTFALKRPIIESILFGKSLSLCFTATASNTISGRLIEFCRPCRDSDFKNTFTPSFKTLGYFQLQRSRGSSQPVGPCYFSEILGCFEDMFDSSNRNHDPIRAIIELVADLIHGLIQQICLEQDLEVVGFLWHEDGPGRGFQIALQKYATHLAVPNVGPALQKRDIFRPHG